MTSNEHSYPGASLRGASMKGTWFNGKRPKSPFIPLYERGKPSISPPLCKGETEGILHGADAKFLRSNREQRNQVRW